jgi:hypothetical protein
VSDETGQILLEASNWTAALQSVVTANKVPIPVGGEGEDQPFAVTVGKTKVGIGQWRHLVRPVPSSFQK